MLRTALQTVATLYVDAWATRGQAPGARGERELVPLSWVLEHRIRLFHPPTPECNQ